MDIEENRLPRRSRRMDKRHISSIFTKAFELLGKDGKRGPAVLFLFLEAVSVVLDVFERSKWASLAAFLLSAFGFAINIYVSYLERTTTEIKPQAERQLGIVEIVFSVLQLIATFIHFILLVSDVKYNYNASVVFPLAFSVIAIVFVFKEEEKVTDSSLGDLPTAKFSSANDSVLSTPIELDLRGTAVDHANPNNKLRFRSRQVKLEGPGIEQFQISGEATPGEELMGCGYPVRGTTVCMFQWVRHLQDGTRHSIEGATEPGYVVTADDVGKLIALECVPMDDQGCEGEMWRAFANGHSKIKCDLEMQIQIDMHISKGESSFSVLLLIPSSENQVPATLTLRQASFQIKINSTEAVVIEENFSVGLLIKIPVGLSTEFILTCSDGASHRFSTSNFRMRDTLVLTMRMFQSQANARSRAKRIRPDE